MNHLKSNAFSFLLLAVTVTFATTALAGTTKNGDVVIYNSGQAQISESRTVTLPRGPANVVVRDIPTSIDASTIMASARNMDVLGMEYRFTPATEKNLLDQYVGKQLAVLVPSLDGQGHTKKTGTLLSNSDTPVFRFGKEIYAGPYGGLFFPELPKSIQETPSLVLNTDSEIAGDRDIRFSYLMTGLNWRADYALVMESGSPDGALTGWATIDNTGAHGFTAARMTLVAGDVRRSRPALRKNRTMVHAMEADMAMAAPPSVVKGTVSQYHTYTLDDRVDLPAGTTRQIRLISTPEVGVRKELESTFHAHGNARVANSRQPVTSRLVIPNTEKNGLGRPLPAGTMRVYMRSNTSQPLLVGEPTIPHTGAGGTLELVLGNAFDVTVERASVKYTKLGKRAYEVSWRIAVLNGKDAPQQLRLKDIYTGEWSITRSSQSYTTPDHRTAQFDLTVPPTQDGNPFIVTYTAHVSY